ncbi:methyltransferase-like protein 24 isoform X3 [Fukomys damarensis]|uniref:methyltransferase-like protein 24 isoform X3 n=1 Tax=Fukomys damarensis TaxID=885580 RepID=UPI001455BD35|nr:methyltransferase-like protein 24 isoform X3 [Fukomys damarensis]
MWPLGSLFLMSIQKRWFRETFDHLSSLASSAEAVDAGVHLLSGWQIFRSIPTEQVPFWVDVVLGFRKMTEAELKKFPQYVFGHAFTTLKCETSVYLPWLEKSAHVLRGEEMGEGVDADTQRYSSSDCATFGWVLPMVEQKQPCSRGEAPSFPPWMLHHVKWPHPHLSFSMASQAGLDHSLLWKPILCMGGCGPRWQIQLQPWAGPAQSLDEEAWRFLRYISTTQIACNHMSTDSLATDSSPANKPWLVCLDDRFGLAHQIRSKQCRLYSLGLGSDDTRFEVSMANDGCEVHRFDPTVKSAHVLESQRLWYHRLSIDWRDPHPALAAQKPYSNTRKLGSILNEFGHHKIDVLKADLESAEWKVLENLILEDVLEQIGQLVFEIHLHWPGFEVSGSDSSVVRFWYSLLKELEQKDFRLFHSYKDLSKPQLFLKKDLFNASSCYTLSWVNTRWK